MSEAKFNQGPWFADGHTVDLAEDSEDNDGLPICICKGPDAEANAARIVLCMNAHDDLLAAAKETNDFLLFISNDYTRRNVELNATPDFQKFKGIGKRIQDAILLAEGGK